MEDIQKSIEARTKLYRRFLASPVSCRALPIMSLMRMEIQKSKKRFLVFTPEMSGQKDYITKECEKEGWSWSMMIEMAACGLVKEKVPYHDGLYIDGVEEDGAVWFRW
jgi:hypothetical protein